MNRGLGAIIRAVTIVVETAVAVINAAAPGVVTEAETLAVAPAAGLVRLDAVTSEADAVVAATAAVKFCAADGIVTDAVTVAVAAGLAAISDAAVKAPVTVAVA